jgi:hypothetical protein
VREEIPRVAQAVRDELTQLAGDDLHAVEGLIGSMW